MSCYTAQLRNATLSNSLAYCMLNMTSTLVVRKKILRSVGLSWQYSCFSLADLTLPCAAGHGDSVALCAARFDSVKIMEVLIANSVKIDTKALGFEVVDSNKIYMLRLLLGTTDNDFADQSRLQAIECILPVTASTWVFEEAQFLMDELNYDRTKISAHEQTVLKKALLAVFNLYTSGCESIILLS